MDFTKAQVSLVSSHLSSYIQIDTGSPLASNNFTFTCLSCRLEAKFDIYSFMNTIQFLNQLSEAQRSQVKQPKSPEALRSF